MSRRGWGRRFGGPAASSAFSPLSLSPVLWLRADMGITLNGSNVSSWADQSGAGHDVTQGTAANQPKYNATDAAYNGKATVQWNDATDFLASAAWSPPSVGTVFVVGNTGGAGTEIFFISNDLAAWELYQNAALDLRFFGSADLTAVSTDMNQPGMLSVDINGASSKIYQNSNTALVTGNTGTYAPTGVTVGKPLASGGKLAELIVYSSVLSAANRALISSYIASRYGFTVT